MFVGNDPFSPTSHLAASPVARLKDFFGDGLRCIELLKKFFDDSLGRERDYAKAGFRSAASGQCAVPRRIIHHVVQGAMHPFRNRPGRTMNETALSAWQVDESNFPLNGSLEEKLRFAVNYAILAPSSHNTQPWRFLIQRDTVQICADRSRALPVTDPFDRELLISCGAALFNLRAVLSRFGCAYDITTFPYASEPDVLALLRVHAQGHLDRESAALVPAITRRVTDRHAFPMEKIAAPLQAAWSGIAADEGAALCFVESEERRVEIAELIAEVDRVQFQDASFRRELASWIHPSHSRDGMPAYSQGVHALLDFATPIVNLAIRTFDVGGGVAASHRRLAQGSPLLACFATTMDDASAWLATGQALQRVLLVVTNDGFGASYLNQPIEVPQYRARLRQLTGCETYPQILLRIGRGGAQHHSPRRPLREVLV